MATLESLNFHHLRYFWVVAREGGLVPAGRVLRLSHPTLSAQIRQLEEQLGEQLFAKVGRKLALTEVGQVAFRYAEEIFGLGRDLVEAVQGRAGRAPARLDVGVVDVLPKLVVRRLLQPALALPEPVRLTCHEGTFEALLAALAQHELDLVLADTPVPSGSPVRAHHHLLGGSGVGLFAAPALARSLRAGFPGSLDGAPFLLPAERLTLRRSLDQWLGAHAIRPRVVAEFADSALLTVFGADGAGVFPAPLAVAAAVESQHGVRLLGEVDGVAERFYAISMERRLQSPAALAISRAAHETLRVEGALRG